jgi:hypothetical protein
MVRLSLFNQLYVFLFRYLAFFLEICLNILDPADEYAVFTFSLPIFAEIDILSVVSYHHRDYPAILIQFDYKIGCVIRRDDAVYGSYGLAVPLLGDALSGGKVEEGKHGP